MKVFRQCCLNVKYLGNGSDDCDGVIEDIEFVLPVGHIEVVIIIMVLKW